MISEMIGSCRVLEKLGLGGMGVVYKAVDTTLERPVAIKYLRAQAADDTSLVERIRREAVTLARLGHPNIATLYNFLAQDGKWFMVMEFAEGRPLDRVMKGRAQKSSATLPERLRCCDGKTVRTVEA